MLVRSVVTVVGQRCGCKLFSSTSIMLVNHISRCVHRRYSEKKESTNKYDVIIAGGGMVGGTMACALGKSSYMQGKKILLLDAGPQTQTDILNEPPIYHSNRVCAISPGSVEFLDSLNIWKKIPRSAAVRKMQVWDSCSDAVMSFDKDNMSEDLCRITENSMLVAAITKTLQCELMNCVEVKHCKRVQSCQFPQQYKEGENDTSYQPTTIILDDGCSLETKLLIAADGANSTIVKESGIKLLKWNYDQAAVVATLKLSEPADNFVAWQRFLPTGPIALLPLTNETSSLVWSTSHSHAKDLVEMDEEAFASEINTAFWQNYPQSEIVGRMKDFLQSILPDNNSVMQYPPSISGIPEKQQMFPLGFAHANEYVKTGLAVIGDACHRVHPLAGQGVNLGLRDVACLTNELNKAVYDGEYLGNLNHLLEYEKQQQLSNLAFAASIDGLKWLYSTDNSAVVALRTGGLMFTNAITPLKP